MKPEEIAALPPSMQKRYEDSKTAYLVPDNRLFLAPIEAGHIFTRTRKDAMKAFIIRGSGSSLAEEEPDGIPKGYQVFIVKEGFPTLDETDQSQATLTAQPPSPSLGAPSVANPVDNG